MKGAVLTRRRGAPEAADPSPRVAAQTRLTHLDLLRGAALLYIVCVEHMDAYSPALDFDNPVTRVVTVCVLGAFVFLSGYLLATRHEINALRDAGRFYLRRLLRIYPMYVLALLCFAFLHITTWTMAWKGILCANVVSGTSPPTLWFVEVVCWFYLVTPLFLRLAKRNPALALAAGASVLCGLVLTSQLSHGAVDARLAQYWPVFLAGILLGKQRHWMRAVSGSWSAAISAVLLAAIGWGIAQTPSQPIVALVLRQASTLASVSLFLAAAAAVAPHVPARVLGFMSYCSFGAYLLHRVVFTLAVRAYRPTSVSASLLYLLCLCVPVIYALAWMVQRGVDGLSTLGAHMPRSRAV